MRNRPWPIELDIYSAIIGLNPLMVQGPGGNTSFKNENTLWIKSSGTRLSNAKDQEIFVGVAVGSRSVIDSQTRLKTSIEIDFHLLIPYPYVIHTHSLRSLSMGIVQNFGECAARFPDIAFVNYARPGKQLCELISQSIDFNVHKAAILQNHGFLTWGNTMEEAYSVLEKFENGVDLPVIIEAIAGYEASIGNHPQAITPDYAVFLSPCTRSEILEFSGQDLWKKQMYLVAEQACALAKAESEINYLSASEVNSLQNWDAEKFRIAANK